MMELPTKGSLKEISFIALIQDAFAAKLTGMIRMEAGSVIKVVYMQQGSVAFASSNEKSDRLTEVLKRAGKLTPEQIDHAQARLKPNVSLGKTLVELGYISPKDLLWGARMQVEGILHQLLFWDQGTYQVIEGPLPKEIVSLSMPVAHIIFDGILKIQDRNWVLHHIGSPQSVYSLAVDFHEKSSQYKLPVEDTVSRMNGKRTLEEIAQAAGLDTFDVCKTAAALQILGLVLRAPVEVAQEVPVLIAEVEREQPLLGAIEIIPAAPRQDVALGEVLQIPTVAELQQQETDSRKEQLVEEAPAGFPETLILQSQEPPPVVEEQPQEPTPVVEVEPEPAAPTILTFREEPLSVVEEEDTENLDRAEPEPLEEEPEAPTIRFGEKSEPRIAQQFSVPMEGLTAPRRGTSRPYQSTWNWKRTALITAIIALVALGATALYTRFLFSPIPEPPIGGPVVEPPKVSPPQPEPRETMKPAEPNAEPAPATPATSTPKPAAPPATKPPAAKPAAPATPLGLVQSGKLAEAAQAWRKQLAGKKSRYTIQLEIACQANTVMEAFEVMNHSPEVALVPLDFKGRSCYRVLYGVFNTSAEAETSRKTLPKLFLQQQSPAQVILVSKALK